MATPGVSTGLIYHWLLDGDATDETGTLDLTEYGGISYTADVPSVLSGVVTQSADLDGSADYLQTASSITFKSLSCWFKIDTFASQSRVFDWSANGCSPICLTNGNLRFIYRDSTNSFKTLPDKTGLSTGVWHHILWSGDSVNNALYFNGSLHASSTDGFLSTVAIATLGRFGSGGEFFNGKIADFRLYSDAKTAGDAATIYAGDYGGGGSPDGAAAYYYRHLMGL
jgi:hypothetical protein